MRNSGKEVRPEQITHPTPLRRPTGHRGRCPLKEHHDPKLVALTGTKPTPNQVNLADDPKHAAKLKEMEALLLAEMRRHDDPYRFWNQPDDGLPVPIIRERNKNKQPKKPKKNP